MHFCNAARACMWPAFLPIPTTQAALFSRLSYCFKCLKTLLNVKLNLLCAQKVICSTVDYSKHVRIACIQSRSASAIGLCVMNVFWWAPLCSKWKPFAPECTSVRLQCSWQSNRCTLAAVKMMRSQACDPLQHTSMYQRAEEGFKRTIACIINVYFIPPNSSIQFKYTIE